MSPLDPVAPAATPTMPFRPRSRRSPATRLLLAIAIGWSVLIVGWLVICRPMIVDAGAAADDGLLARTIAARAAKDERWRDPEHALFVGRTVLTRAGIAWAIACGLVAAWPRRQRIGTATLAYLTEPDDARNLAVLRMATFGALVVTPAGREEFLVHASLPDELLFPPGGLGGLIAALKPGPDAAQLVLWTWIAATAMAFAGLLTRIAAPVAAVLAILVLGVPQLHGKVNHAHHLVWFALLLAASPCGDAWSLDAWWRRRATPGRSVAYGLPLRISWLLLGMVYLFPGFWKLWTGGVDWFASDHLRNQIWLQWSTHDDWRPAFDPTGWPWLVRFGALATIIFELSFLALVVRRRTRPVAMLLGLGFHTVTWLTIRIGFVSLQICYVALVDWAGLVDRIRGIRRSSNRGSTPPRGTTAALLVGAVLIFANAWYGLLGRHVAWPFACYPKFAYPIREPERTVIEATITTPDGTTSAVSFATSRGKMRTARWIGVMTTVLRLPDGPRRDAAFEALARIGLEAPPGSTLRFDAMTISVHPDESDAPPRDARELATFTTRSESSVGSDS